MDKKKTLFLHFMMLIFLILISKLVMNFLICFNIGKTTINLIFLSIKLKFIKLHLIKYKFLYFILFQVILMD